MKVRVTYTLNLSKEEREAIGWELSQRHDEFDAATHEQIRVFFEDAIEYTLNDVLEAYDCWKKNAASQATED